MQNYSLILGAIILLLVVLIFIILYYKQKKYFLNEISSIKLEALRAQINPHFLSNTLNSIDSLVNQGRNEEASEYLVKFSRFFRLILENSKESSITLREDIDVLKYYLSLEKLRFSDELNYVVSIDHRLNLKNIITPPMLLQPFVENALFHGIRNLPETKRGELKIEINMKSEYMLEFIIEDNGVGRRKSKLIQQSSLLYRKSRGGELSKQRIELLTGGKGANLEIIDLYDGLENSRGTRVVIEIPLKQK